MDRLNAAGYSSVDLPVYYHASNMCESDDERWQNFGTLSDGLVSMANDFRGCWIGTPHPRPGRPVVSVTVLPSIPEKRRGQP